LQGYRTQANEMTRVKPSMFNVTVPLPGGDEVFIMNTFTDAQAIVSRDVVDLLDRIDRTADASSPALAHPEREAVAALAAEGFVVESRAAERARLDDWFRAFQDDCGEMRVTVLTTLQCNFACDYCIQGDHGDYNTRAGRMSLETAARVVEWMAERLDALEPSRLVVTFFGGEPLLNLPVLYHLAEQASDLAKARGVELLINVITNGLLLTPEVVDRLTPFGLNGVKVTLDGDRGTHNRLRPLRGGQGTFDRIIDNLRQVAGKCRIAIGGNFDETSVQSYPALLEFLKSQAFAPAISKVTFKPVIGRNGNGRGRTSKSSIPLTAVDDHGRPLQGACMTSVGSGGSSPCDTCHFVDEQMSHLREETKRAGFPTLDGVHMGPCEIHRRASFTVGPDGDLYACPGFAGEAQWSTGHIDGRESPQATRANQEFANLAPWRQCDDCAFIPVCGGGCTVASHNELGDMHAPTCHKSSFQSALVSLAHERAGVQTGGLP
jgi:uncharacterized protein